MKHITARPHGYEVLIKRGDLQWRALVPYTVGRVAPRAPFSDLNDPALARAIELRARFYKICGPVTRKNPRSNTDVVGVTETTHWVHGLPFTCFIVGVRLGGMSDRSRWTNRRFYFGSKGRLTRDGAFRDAVAWRAQAIGKTPAELLPKFNFL